MKRSLLFLGALDYPNVPKAGDAIKNRYLVDFFKRELNRVDYVDTQRWKKNPIVLLRVIWHLTAHRYENIVISTSNVSAYRLIGLTTSLNLKSRIYYFMIGGYAPVKIKQGIYKADRYRKLERIIVEADKVEQLYHDLEIYNTIRLYNFKRVLYTPDLTNPHTGIIRFVFLSRITELKGVFHILQSVRELNDSGYGNRYEVDFYGRIDSDIEERFLNEVNTISNVSYKGFLNLDDAQGYKTLSEYDAMLFPTLYATEGFPGVIADAAIAALPVIASDWRYADEIIGNDECGLLFPTGNNEALTELMARVIDNRALLEPLRKNALQRSDRYNADKVLNKDLIAVLGMDKPITD